MFSGWMRTQKAGPFKLIQQIILDMFDFCFSWFHGIWKWQLILNNHWEVSYLIHVVMKLPWGARNFKLVI